MKIFLIKIINSALSNFTIAKFLGGLLTALIVASLKYYISGSFHVEYSEFSNNLGIALAGWTLNTGIMGWLTEYLDIKGLNYNLRQFIYGFDTMNIGGGPSDYPLESFKPKLYNAMDSDEDSNTSKKLDKGKGVDRELYPLVKQPVYVRELETRDSVAESQETGKGKGRVKVKVILDSPEPVEPHMVTWSKVFPGADPAFILPIRTNPGPGFNVPGGEVPIRDNICRHIDYSTNILSQFKKMDLETAIEQRNNNLIFVKVIETKLDYARKTLSGIPAIPTTQYEFNLKNQILRDLDSLSRDKVRAEARATLLYSRIQYIEGKLLPISTSSHPV